jgi:hypothetical protein
VSSQVHWLTVKATCGGFLFVVQQAIGQHSEELARYKNQMFIKTQWVDL